MGRRILLVNDDGYTAEGLFALAREASFLGEVTVVAPEKQCSAMSHRLTLRREMDLKRRSLPLVGIKEAYSLSGTPADCVKVALHVVMSSWPDVVLCGVNAGLNCGYDIAYSATVAAAIEARMKGIPAIAFSQAKADACEARDHYLPLLLRELLEKEPGPEEIWNVNFPEGPLTSCRGVLYEQRVFPDYVFADAYKVEKKEEGHLTVTECGEMEEANEIEGTDLCAVRHGFVSVGRVKGSVFA